MLKNYFLYLVFSIISLYATASYGQDEYTETFQYQYSHAQFDSCIQLIRNLLPKYEKDLPQRIKLLNLLGKSYVRNYQYEEGQEAYTKAAELNKGNRNGLISKDDYIASLLGVCDVYAALEMNVKLKALLDSISRYKNLSPHYLFLKGKSLVYENMESAKKYLLLAIEYPQQHEIAHLSYMELSKILLWKNELGLCFIYLNKAIKNAEQNFPNDKTIKAACYNELGKYYFDEGLLRKSLVVLRDSALGILKFSNRASLINKSEILITMAQTIEYQGDYLAALDMYQTSLSLKEKYLEKNSKKKSIGYLRLAQIYYSLGLLGDAQEYLNLAEKFYNKLPIQYPDQEIYYILMGHIQRSKGNSLKALKYYDYILDSNLLKATPSLIYTIADGSKATVYFNNNQLYEAKLQNSKNIKLIEQKLGKFHTHLASAHCMRGNIYHKIGNRDSAEIAFEYALKILSKNKVSNHYFTTKTLHGYADLAISNRNFKKAESLLIKLLSHAPHNSKNVSYVQIASLSRLAKCYYKNFIFNKNINKLFKAHETAIKCKTLIDSIEKNYQSKIDEEYLRDDIYREIFPSSIAINYSLFHSLDSSHFLKDSFDLLEKYKGNQINHVLGDISAIRFSNIPDSLKFKESELKLKIFSLQKGTKKNIPFLLRVAKKSYDSLITHLEQNYPEYYNLKYNFNVLSVEEVQQKLKPNEALIEYFNGEEYTYVFTITKDTASFQSIPLVDNTEIEEFRKALTPNFKHKNPSQAYRDYTNSAYELFKKILATPLKNIDTTKVNTLRIIPDGLLGLVPFETLITQPVHTQVDDYGSLPYLFKKYNISYGYSATSMFMFKDQNRTMSASQVLAFAPSKATSSPSVKTASLAPLKWNLQEVLSLNNYFNHYTSTGDKATEAAFKEKIKDYPIAHLAMHAIIDDEDPMYSKLLFAPSKDTLEDGMLHTFELYNMRLNTQMVVLSACNTGSGKLQKGEGVMSLARAFAYAGSPSVVMSHWAVDDKSTAELMKHFYKYLSKGKSKDAALRLAKLDFLKNSSPIYHHPYYWNNFVVMGDPAPVVDPPYWWKVTTLLFFIIFFAITLSITDHLKILKR